MILNRLFKKLPEPSYRYGLNTRFSGEHINHENALKMSAVYAAIRVIAETIAALPWMAFTRTPDGKRHASNSGVEYLLRARPNPETSAMTFRETILAHALSWGNGYAEIERDNASRPIALWLIPPDRVTPARSADDNRLLYRVDVGSGGSVVIESRDMFHVHGLGYDGTMGYSVISLAARSIALGMSAEEWAGAYFGNQVATSGMLFANTTITDASRKSLKDQLEEQVGGRRRFSPLVLPGGIEWKPMTLPAADAQFLESRKFSLTEIARWYRVPPHKLADLERATFSNIEHQSFEFITDTILPWCIRLEQEADYKLFGMTNSTSYTKLNLRNLMRADSAGRAAFYREMRNLGVFNADEIRAWEDMDPITSPGGDKYVLQSNMTTLERIGETPDTPDGADSKQNIEAVPPKPPSKRNGHEYLPN